MMTAAASGNPEDLTASELRLAIEQMLTKHFGRECRIVEFRRRRSDFASSYRMEDLDLVLDDGRELQVVLKAIGAPGMLDDARRTRPAFFLEPMREAELYRSTLGAIGDHAPECYGTTTVLPDHQRYLVLERVEGLELRRVGDFAVWEQTAHLLATIQHTLTGRLRKLVPEGAPPHEWRDRAFYLTWLARAVARVGRSESGSPAAQRSMQRLAMGYGRVVEHLCSLPQVVVHGDCFASNVLVAGTDQPRICFVDWEMSGFGPGLLDVAALVSGGWTDRDREKMLTAYREGTVASGGNAPSLDEMMSSLDICRLHLAIQLLGWSTDWKPPSEQRQDWLEEAHLLAGKLRL